MQTISFVIPVYNEEKRIKKTFQALQELQLPSGLKLEEVIFVNDGSTDNTIQKIKTFMKSQLSFSPKLISYQKNRGKGYAVRQGMLESQSNHTLFFDADMSIPLSEIKKLIPYIEKGIDVIISTRKNGMSTVITHQPLYREILGKGFTLLTNVLLNIWVTDFTCGFKLLSRKAKQAIFAKTTINRWSYDAEIVFLAKKLGFSTVEQAVVWSNDSESKVRLYKDIPQSLIDLLLIRVRHDLLPTLAFAKTLALRYGRSTISLKFV